MGRSDLFLKMEIAKKSIGLVVLLSTMQYGVMMMAYSLLFTSFINQLINSFPNAKLLQYRYIDQVVDMLPQIGASLLMGLIVYLVNFLPVASWAILLIQVPLGVIAYIAISKLFKIDSFQYILETAKGFFNKRKKAVS